ncbi:hypothetical protein FRC04_000096 [Tulasnella sp. 424]|nr:hypothetical protein FRC04_000096 [Tulasnella sp. 424]KAG8981958.1 hypothetical protein FRC05_000100 [Tulasnella sp. 425]
MLQTDSPTSTLLATPRSQIQDLPLQQLSPSSPSPPPSSTLSRRHKSRKNNSSKSLNRRKSVDIKPATPASDQVTIAPSQLSADPTMDWKQQGAANEPIRVDVLATKTGKRFTLPKLFTRSSTKQFDPYSPPPVRPDREPTDGTRGCSEDTTDYPRPKSQSRAKRNAAVAEEAATSRADEVEVFAVASSNGTAESHPDGIHVTAPSPSSDVPITTSSQPPPPAADARSHLSSQPSLPRPAHQESSGSQVPESLYPRGESAMKSPTSRSRFSFLSKQKASAADSNVAGTSRRERRRWTKFWRTLAKKLGWKPSAPSVVGSPVKGKGKAKAPTDSEVGSVVETLPAVDVDEVEDNAVGLNLDVRPTVSAATPPSRSRSNSPYMERLTTLEPHNIPLPGGESSLSLVSVNHADDGTEQEIQENPLHSHSFSSPINASSTSFTTESPLSVPSFLPDRSATTITLPTTVDPSLTCLDLSIEEEEIPTRVEESGDKLASDETLTDDEVTPTASPCPPPVVPDPSASTYTLQLATATAIPEDSDSDFDDEDCPPTPHLPSASHPNQTAPQLTTTSAPEDDKTAPPSPPVATRPDLKRSASTSNVAPPPKRTGGPSKFLFVKHSRWRGNSTLGHELGIRMFEEQYPTIETSLFDPRVQRTWLPPPPPTHDDDGDSIIDVAEDGYSDFEDEPIGGWREYFEDDDYYHDEDGEEDESTELGHGHRHGHGKQGAEHSEHMADVAFCAASSSGSLASSSPEHGHH